MFACERHGFYAIETELLLNISPLNLASFVFDDVLLQPCVWPTPLLDLCSQLYLHVQSSKPEVDS